MESALLHVVPRDLLDHVYRYVFIRETTLENMKAAHGDEYAWPIIFGLGPEPDPDNPRDYYPFRPSLYEYEETETPQTPPACDASETRNGTRLDAPLCIYDLKRVIAVINGENDAHKIQA